MKIRALYTAMLFISPACLALSSPGEQYRTTNLTYVISDYRMSLAALPLDYSLLEEKQLPGVMLRKYSLNSQAWSPQGVVSPERWQNEVDIYIPLILQEKIMRLLLSITVATTMALAVLWLQQTSVRKNLHVLRLPHKLW